MSENKKKRLQIIKEKLIKHKRFIISQLKKFAKRNKNIKGDYQTKFPNLGDHKDENAIEVSDYESNLSVEHNLEDELEKIEGALKKTSKGTYGICSKCGRKINPKRLEAAPEANLCIECGKKSDNK